MHVNRITYVREWRKFSSTTTVCDVHKVSRQFHHVIFVCLHMH